MYLSALLMVVFALAVNAQNGCDEFNLGQTYSGCLGTVEDIIENSNCKENQLLNSIKIVNNCFQGCTNDISQTFWRRLMSQTGTVMDNKCADNNTRTGRQESGRCDIMTVQKCVTGLQIFIVPISASVSDLNRFCGNAYKNKPEELIGNCSRAVATCSGFIQLLPYLFDQVDSIMKVANETVDDVCECASKIKVYGDQFRNSGQDCKKLKDSASMVTAMTNQCATKLRNGATSFNWARLANSYVNPHVMAVQATCAVELSFLQFSKATIPQPFWPPCAFLVVFYLFVLLRQ